MQEKKFTHRTNIQISNKEAYILYRKYSLHLFHLNNLQWNTEIILKDFMWKDNFFKNHLNTVILIMSILIMY